MFQNRLLQSFLTDEKIEKLYLSYVEDPSQFKKDQIENLFQIYVRKIQLLTYFSKVLYFESQKYDKKTRRIAQNNALILDKSVNDSKVTVLDLIGETQPFYELDFSSPINPHDLEFLLEDKHLYQIISKLSVKQKEILYLIYVEGWTEIEVAQKLTITKQAVNKTKNQTLKKIRRDYKQGGI